MTLYVDRFPGPALSAGWYAVDNGGGGSTTVDGQVNFTAEQVFDGGGISDPIDQWITRGFTGDLGGGYVKFRLGMPAVTSGKPYLYAQVSAESPFRFITVQVFHGIPTLSQPIGSDGYTLLVTARYAPASSAPDEYFAYDATKPFFQVLFGDGVVTFQNSADGVDYTTITTLHSGTNPFGSSAFGLLLDAYENSPPGIEVIDPWTIQLDDVEVSYTGLAVPAETASAAWNIARMNLVGDFDSTSSRFGPRPSTGL